MLVRFQTHDLSDRLGWVEGDSLYDLTALGVPELSSLAQLLRQSNPVGIVRSYAERFKNHVVPCSASSLLQSGADNGVTLLPPIDRQEVWAAGVTYRKSEEARKAESEGAAAFYAKVYDAERPEIFFKATPHRTVGHESPVAIREDATWNVPEPELGLVLSSELSVVGYVVGNDMSSRDIEGENPLYLPQAKVYMGSCALGPGITLADEIRNPRELEMGMRIHRGTQLMFDETIQLSQMHRSLEDLVAYLGRANAFPDGVILLTGTGMVPDSEFTLQPGDLIEIWIDRVGTLRNTVEVAQIRKSVV